MRRVRFAVPPGVGDVYWCLTKVQALREKFNADEVELCVQQAGPGRSTDWAKMVDFVDASSFFPFKPGRAVHPPGYRTDLAGVDALLWPNAIVDRGRSLTEWLPDLPIDMDFHVHTADMGASRVVVYASSVAINRAWLPHLGVHYWVDLISELTKQLGPVTLIGAGWDQDYAHKVAVAAAGVVEYENLIGKTSLPQIADILRTARVVIGAISGMTILANHFKTPCIAFYPNAHHDDFPRTWVKVGTPYDPLRSDLVPEAAVVARIARDMARAPFAG